MGLDTVDLLERMETTFGIRIRQQEVAGVVTVGDLYSLVHHYLAAVPAHARPSLPVEATVNALVAEISGFDLPEIHAGQSLTDDLGLD
jgi:acyl carrier protein